jgi:hypothetical protein
MPQVSFQAASAADDADLRRLLRDNPMQQGGLTLSFRREPSYFAACSVLGQSAEVFVGRDTQTGALAGVGARYHLPAFINGQAQSIVYLADLRVQTAYRNSIHLRRAYQFLRQRHAADLAPVYTTMILQDNRAALATIAAQRAGLPPYHAQGTVHTPLILLGWQKPTLAAPCTIRRATAADWAAIVAFLNRENARYQFAPVYHENDLTNGRLREMQPENILLAEANGSIIGTIALWQQSAFRQLHIDAYHGAWRFIRPVYNALARLTPLAPLPRAGEALKYAYLSLIAVQNDDLAVFRALLRHAYRASHGTGLHYLIGAFHERHPLRPAFADYAGIPSGGQLFTVQFDGEPYPLDGRVPYIDAAAI